MTHLEAITSILLGTDQGAILADQMTDHLVDQMTDHLVDLVVDL